MLDITGAELKEHNEALKNDSQFLRERVDALEIADADQKKRIATLEKDVGNRDIVITGLHTEKIDWDRTTTALQTANHEQANVLRTLDAINKAAEILVEKLETEKEQRDANIATLKSEKEDRDHCITALESEEAQCETRIAALELEAELSSDRMSTLRSNLVEAAAREANGQGELIWIDSNRKPFEMLQLFIALGKEHARAQKEAVTAPTLKARAAAIRQSWIADGRMGEIRMVLFGIPNECKFLVTTLKKTIAELQARLYRTMDKLTAAEGLNAVAADPGGDDGSVLKGKALASHMEVIASAERRALVRSSTSGKAHDQQTIFKLLVDHLYEWRHELLAGEDAGSSSDETKSEETVHGSMKRGPISDNGLSGKRIKLLESTTLMSTENEKALQGMYVCSANYLGTCDKEGCSLFHIDRRLVDRMLETLQGEIHACSPGTDKGQ